MTARVYIIAILITCSSLALAAVPSYRVDVIATTNGTVTVVRGASDAGHVVGYQITAGVFVPWVASLAQGLTPLPLPDGYASGAALDVNNLGVVVGTAHTGGMTFDGGEPAIWVPAQNGTYEVIIPQQFDSLPSPLGGTLAINGGMAVAINDAGQIAGWSRFQGFQGGPSTLFSIAGPPFNLSAAGFSATETDINASGVIVGGRLKMDLATMTVTDLGLPAPLQPGNVPFTDTLGYAINDAGEVVAAADLASTVFENYLTFMHNDVDGFIRLNPTQLPSRFVGFYDNNNRGDVSASGGILFRAEGVRVDDYDSLLAMGYSQWDTGLGFIGSDRRVYTTAYNTTTMDNALVQLTPIASSGDSDDDGIDDASDNCILVANPDQRDTNGDGYGNVCDADVDNDGVVNATDLGMLRQVFFGASPDADLDGDGVVNAVDLGIMRSGFFAAPGPSGLVP